MTKVQLQFKVDNPLNENAVNRLLDTSSQYGILGLKLDPASDSITVDFDATRLRVSDVEAVLARAGVAAHRAQ